MVLTLLAILFGWCIFGVCVIELYARLAKDRERLTDQCREAERTLRAQSVDVCEYLATIEEQRQKIADHAEEIMQLRCIDEKREKIDLLQRERLEMARASLDAIAGSAKDSLSKLPI